MEVEISFGLWLQKRRKALDLTREELAQKVGCSVSGLRKIENDARHPSKQLAELLALALNIPADERPAFLTIARRGLSLERSKFQTPLPSLNLLHPPATFSRHMPVPATPLIGRETELAALRQMLGDSQCRLITLVGPGGSGKTRLAIEVACNSDIPSPDSVAFVPLAGVGSTDLIIPAIASALDFTFDGPNELHRQLLNHLKEKQTFLILDNLEHLLDGVGIISDMIEYAPKVKVLCTSREQLNLHGEWVFEVRGLPVPPSAEGPQFDHSSAVRLFLQRASQVKAIRTLRNEDRAAIVRICKLVEGMPLAIELSAVWTRTLSLQEIALEIEKGLDFLSTNMRDIPERHRSLRAVFDHSWRRLSNEEREVLMQLTVFQGGFTRELAEQVANANLSMLSALIMKSLVHRLDEQRYDLHEAIRQYGSIQLELAHKVEQTRAVHLQTFVHLAETIEPELSQSEQHRWLAYLEIEHDNFRAALRWAFDSGDIESSLRLTVALWRFWFIHSHFIEGSQWLEKALQSTDPGANPALRAKVLNGAGLLAYYQNNFDQAKSKLEECLALQSHLSEHDIAYAQMTIAYIVHDQFDFTRAASLYAEALRRFRRLNDAYGIIRALNCQGVLAFDMGNLDTAASLFNECLVLARERKDRGNMALAITNLGWTAALRGDETAMGLCQEGMRLYHELGNKLGIAFCLEGVGAGCILVDQSERAVQLFSAANILRQTIATLLGGTHALHVEAMLQRARNALSKETFVSAWARGEALSLEQAIELALVSS